MNDNEIHIRKMKSSTLLTLKQISKSKGISLNKYVNSVLDVHVIAPELMDLENKYSKLVHMLSMLIKENTAVLKQIKEIME